MDRDLTEEEEEVIERIATSEVSYLRFFSLQKVHQTSTRKRAHEETMCVARILRILRNNRLTDMTVWTRTDRTHLDR